MSFFRKKKQEEKAPAVGCVAVTPNNALWCYAGTDGTWKNFSSPHITALESAFHSEAKSTQLTISGAEWQINFTESTMKQLPRSESYASLNSTIYCIRRNAD